jgi:hypothetical protein
VNTKTCLYCWQQCEIFCSSMKVWRNHCCISMATLNSSVFLKPECGSALKGNALLCFHSNNFSIFILLTVTCCWTVPNALMHFHGNSGYTCYSYIVYLVFVCFQFILSQVHIKIAFHKLSFSLFWNWCVGTPFNPCQARWMTLCNVLSLCSSYFCYM